MPAAIATVPSNGPVAPTGRATSPPGESGDAFLQLLRTADTAAAEPAAGVPSDPAQAEAASETADAAPPALAAKPAPEVGGTPGGTPKAARTGKPAPNPDPAAGSATDPANAGIAPLPVVLPLTLDAEPPANRAPAQQATAAGDETDPKTLSAADRPVHETAVALPAGAAEAAAPPAETARPLRTAARAADEPAAQRAPAPAANLAITSSALSAEPAATTQAASAPAAPARAAPAEAAHPAAQIGSAVLTLGPAADGSQQITLRLHPAELGVVQVQIGRSESGAAHVEITAEKADTMQALLRDQPQLHRALDDAGVPAAGRTITFHTAPVQSAPVQSASAGGNGSGSLTSHQGGAGTADGNSARGSGKGGYGGEPGGDTAGRRPGRSFTDKTAATAAISFRVGVDIVA